MNSVISYCTNLFPLWAIVFAGWAYAAPGFWAQGKGMIAPLLGVVMICMGMTLTFDDFRRVLRQPWVIGIGVVMHYVIMPLAAFGISHLLHLPPELMVGMMLVGCVPSGTASEVITYLAGADVALSVTMTLCSTMIAFAVTPFLVWLFAGTVVPVPAGGMMLDVLKIVILPVLTGVLINTFWSTQVKRIASVFPLLSVLTIVTIIAIVVAVNQDQLKHIGPVIMLAVVLHNMVGYVGGYWGARLLGLDIRVARTISIESGMQNSGLAVALAVKYFAPAAALPGALFSIWHNVSGALLASYWKRSIIKVNAH